MCSIGWMLLSCEDVLESKWLYGGIEQKKGIPVSSGRYRFRRLIIKIINDVMYHSHNGGFVKMD